MAGSAVRVHHGDRRREQGDQPGPADGVDVRRAARRRLVALAAIRDHAGPSASIQSRFRPQSVLASVDGTTVTGASSSSRLRMSGPIRLGPPASGMEIRALVREHDAVGSAPQYCGSKRRVLAGVVDPVAPVGDDFAVDEQPHPIAERATKPEAVAAADRCTHVCFEPTSVSVGPRVRRSPPANRRATQSSRGSLRSQVAWRRMPTGPTSCEHRELEDLAAQGFPSRLNRIAKREVSNDSGVAVRALPDLVVATAPGELVVDGGRLSDGERRRASVLTRGSQRFETGRGRRSPPLAGSGRQQRDEPSPELARHCGRSV